MVAQLFMHSTQSGGYEHIMQSPSKNQSKAKCIQLKKLIELYSFVVFLDEFKNSYKNTLFVSACVAASKSLERIGLTLI